MKYLKDADYHIISFGDLENYFRRGTTLPSRPVVLSFDDGWSDQYIYAFPILEKYHYTATFFVFTNPVGTKGFITWAQLRAMRAAGMTIGSHTRSHPYLTRISDPTLLRKEIVDSKQVLEKQLGTPVTDFAYPFGQYNAAVAAAVEAAGYLTARGDRYKSVQSTNLYELNALNAPTTTELFARQFPR
jgi:peptidoglycan/xylan/chitin deacetylase (PgdA/CDA1 family)